ncbi:Excisionase [Gammaproteobacteria bacterium]
MLKMIRYLTIGKFSDESGYTEDAIRTKIRDGVWPEKLVWIKAPDGRTLINTEGYNEWVESGSSTAFEPPRKRPSKLTSIMQGSVAASVSNSSPPPLI